MPADAQLKYQRLPGSGIVRNVGSVLTVSRTYCRLWLGEDHLLQVEFSGYSENYKRFYFRDIQAICLRKTNSWLIRNFVLGALTGFFLLWTLITKNFAGFTVLVIIAGLFGFFLMLNLLRGPTCGCHLKTAVHLEELPSLRRRRNAEKFLARIQPLIETAQGIAGGETLATQYAALLADAHAVPAKPGQSRRVAIPGLSDYRSRAHQVLFFALLADSVAATLNIFLPGIPAVLLAMATAAILAGAVLVALVKQHQTDLKGGVRAVTWLAAGFAGVGYMAGYIIMVVMTPAAAGGTQWGYIKAIADLRPFQTNWWLTFLCVTAAATGLLGATGLLLLKQHWQEKGTDA